MKTITIRLALFGLIGIPVLSGAGCTHVPLRRNTSRQAETLSEIYQQQVLDNLAKFVYDYNSLPHFAYADAGSTTVSDTATASGTVNWARIFFDTGDLGFTGSRNNEEAWTLTPVSDPRKLELMRCAYQRAVSSCVAQAESGGCPDCEKRFRDYYTGSPDGKIPAPGSPEDPGIVTSECLRSDCCWFHVACKGCVGKHGPCCRVGHYRGVYVVVPPGRGQAELTELTLAVLDYAVNKPAEEESVPSKEVTLYLDAEGRPTNQAGAARVIKATEPATGNELGLLKPYVPQMKRLLASLQKKLQTAAPAERSDLTREIADLSRQIEEIEGAPAPRATYAPGREAAPRLPRREPEFAPSGIRDLRLRLRALAPEAPAR